MSVPAGSVCASHADAPATYACPRCGSFMCVACERRTRPEAVPLCPNCWDLRSKTTVPQNNDRDARLQTTGFVLGFISLLPFWPVVLASLIINIVSLVKAKPDSPLRPKRWKSVTGLVVTLCSCSLWALVAAIAIFAGKD